MPKCTFCGCQIGKGTGKMFVLNSGKVLYFCSMKCEKNLLKLKRKPHRVRWTEAFKKMKKTGIVEEVEIPVISQSGELKEEKNEKK